jgi:hypothetical protein
LAVVLRKGNLARSFPPRLLLLGIEAVAFLLAALVAQRRELVVSLRSAFRSLLADAAGLGLFLRVVVLAAHAAHVDLVFLSLIHI